MKDITLREEIDALTRRVSALEARLTNSTNTIVLDKELDRVMEKIHTLKATYAGMQTWSHEDRVRLCALTNRKKELMTLLGVKE